MLQPALDLKRQARLAGLLYFVSSIFGVIGMVYVPGRLITVGNASATAAALRNSESLFRAGMASEVVGTVMFVFVALALYRLFEGVSQKQAATMVILILLAAPMSFFGVICELAAPSLSKGASFLAAFDQHQLEALAYLFIRLHSYGIVIAAIFWGLWLFPFGMLVIRSGFIPRILGYLLITAAFGYLINSMTFILLPSVPDFVSLGTQILQALELPIIFWLLIWGTTSRSLTASLSAD